jgi:hypothetical protein
MAESIGLAEFIAEVKRELMEPLPGGVDPVPLLSVEDINVECKVTLTKQGKAGIHIHVIELGGTAGRDDVHTVTVKLSPLVSREQRLALLSQRGQLKAIEDAAVTNMVKGATGNERRADQYAVEPR